MPTGLRAKLALTTVAALGLYAPTLGLALPLNSCLRSVGVATAAPSPSCGSDLRECLRASADMHQTTFGGRYVTAEDVARCMEAFNACAQGGASRGGNPVPPTSTAGRDNSGKGLPEKFRIEADFGVGFPSTKIDCRINGDAASCTSTRDEPLPNGGTYSAVGEINGIVSGLTMTGTFDRHSTSGGDSSGCVSEQDHSGPVHYDFSPDGSVSMREGPTKVDTVFTGTCANSPPIAETQPAWQWTGTWTPSG